MKYALLAAAALGFSIPANAYVPSQFVIFGDSFIDAGTVANATGNLVPDPALGYWYGRFSDGPTWADQLGYANFGAPTQAFNVGPLPFTPGATSFAVGGARASFDDVQMLGTIPSLPSQLGLFSNYMAFTGQAFDPDALYILNFGNNDVNLIQSLAGDPAAQAAVFNAYVANMTNAVVGLSSFGAKNILLLGVPNPLEAEGIALQSALDASLDLVEANPMFTANLFRFDYFGFFNTLVADPTAYGLPAGLITDQTMYCLAVLGPGQDCSNFLSFDGIHVTRGVHRALALEIGRQVGIATIPEPATWGMMLAGFGAIGFAMRRRERLAA